MPLAVYVSRNGTLIPPAQASVAISNPAIYGAYGVYESMQVHGGAIFAVKDHLRRLARSAQLLDLPLPADLLTIETWCRDIIRANDAADCTLRLTIIGPDEGDTSIAYLWPQDPTAFPRSHLRRGRAGDHVRGAAFHAGSQVAEYAGELPGAAQRGGARRP